MNSFPIYSHLDSLCDTLKKSSSHVMILTAETGAGKSTIFPLGLLEKFNGKILMTQPRRLSVLGTCSRISDLLNEEIGNTCGYRIHLENKINKNTRLEIVTEAIALRMIQEDFALEKFNILILDEFHERSLNLDLLSAFIKDALGVREDLFVVIMSATIDAEKISHYFFDSPIVKIPGRTFPVQIEYKSDSTMETEIVREFNSTNEGNILAFLPGLNEIKKCAEKLEEKFSGIENVQILKLHSSISTAEQKKILSPAEKNVRRIIISSAIAETSVTVPGIKYVIDSGLCRTKIFDLSTGMEKLVTIAESEFSAAQRSGRAGRTEKGKCIRLWSKNEIRPKEMLPEIERSDLSRCLLECAERGETDCKKINFIDPPKTAMWNESKFFLEQIGMIKNNSITQKGKIALKLGTEIRMAGILIAAKNSDKLLNYAKKIWTKISQINNSTQTEKEWNDIIHKLNSIQLENEINFTDEKLLLLEGFSDRLAKLIDNEYQFTNGRKGVLHPSVKTNSSWIVALEADAGNSNSIIYKAEEISGKEFEQWIKNNSTTKIECSFSGEKIIKEEKNMFGKIVLSSKRIPSNDEDFILAWKNEIQSKGINVLPLDEKCKNFLMRTNFYRQQKNITSNIEEELQENFDEWLLPFLGGKKSIDSKTVYDALFYFLDGITINNFVPESIEFPNGKKFKILYEKNDKIRPVVQVIIQRIFGCFKTPEIMGEKILLKLLSPASRPLQITDDLENFWNTTWIEICKEMKGRYPKHNWDYKVLKD